jgi:hypothetical protein
MTFFSFFVDVDPLYFLQSPDPLDTSQRKRPLLHSLSGRLFSPRSEPVSSFCFAWGSYIMSTRIARSRHRIFLRHLYRHLLSLWAAVCVLQASCTAYLHALRRQRWACGDLIRTIKIFNCRINSMLTSTSDSGNMVVTRLPTFTFAP